MDVINSIVAVNVRALREERRLSLDALASMTGVSKSLLGMIERGTANPTISTLWKIANGLKVPPTRFMVRREERLEIKRIKDIAPLLGDNGGGYRNYPLFPVDGSRPFEVYRIEIDPAGGLRAEPHPPGTQEIVTVVAGTLELSVDDRKEVLPEGTAVRFFADVAHAYYNPGKKMCRLDMVIAFATAK